MVWNELNQHQMVRNTRTLDAYRTRAQAANRAGQPFLLLPILFNPALYGPALIQTRGRMPVWLFLAICLVWLTLAGASLAFGVYRRQKYLQEHPFQTFGL